MAGAVAAAEGAGPGGLPGPAHPPSTAEIAMSGAESRAARRTDAFMSSSLPPVSHAAKDTNEAWHAVVT